VVQVGYETDIRGLEKAWVAVQEAGGVSHPMYSWEWASTWWEVFGEGRELLGLTARAEGRVLAIAPFVLRRARMNRLFTFRRLELVGTGEDQRDEVFSEYVDFPVLPGAGVGAVERLADEVLGLDGAASWDDLVLYRVRPQSVACTVLASRLSRRGLCLSRLDSDRCPYVALPRTAEEYDRQLSANRRQQIRRGLRALERMGEVSFRKAATVGEALETLDHLARLHQARWRDRGRQGAFASDRFRAFHRRFVERTFDRGWPELWTLRVKGEALACLYNINYQGRICFYQSGVRVMPNDRIRPGLLAHYLAVRAAIQAGATEYDFLLGAAQYKLSLSNAARELVTLRASRPGAREALRRTLVSVVRPVRRVLAGAGGGARS